MLNHAMTSNNETNPVIITGTIASDVEQVEAILTLTVRWGPVQRAMLITGLQSVDSSKDESTATENTVLQGSMLPTDDLNQQNVDLCNVALNQLPSMNPALTRCNIRVRRKPSINTIRFVSPATRRLHFGD
jgi:hypothetical protein